LGWVHLAFRDCVISARDDLSGLRALSAGKQRVGAGRRSKVGSAFRSTPGSDGRAELDGGIVRFYDRLFGRIRTSGLTIAEIPLFPAKGYGSTSLSAPSAAWDAKRMPHRFLALRIAHQLWAHRVPAGLGRAGWAESFADHRVSLVATPSRQEGHSRESVSAAGRSYRVVTAGV